MADAAPFFIVGSARSGTTMLRLMLNAHPDVAVPPESRFIVELWTGASEVARSELLGALERHKRFQVWDMPIEAVAEEIGDRPRLPYAEAIRATYGAYARFNGKSRWGDKTPRYVLDIPFLAELLPDARFVHMIRDGRNVALSYADVPFGPKNVSNAARTWSERVAAGLSAGRALPSGRYLEIHYEDVVDDPEGETKALCGFLGLDFDPRMLDETERARGAIKSRADRYNPSVTQAGISERRSWQQDMPPDQVEIFECIAGPVLSELGYERRFPHPGAAARAKALLSRAGLPVGRLKGRSRT